MDILWNNILRLINNLIILINDLMLMLLEVYSKIREDFKFQLFECYYNNFVYFEKLFVKSFGRSFMEEMILYLFYLKFLVLNLSLNLIWYFFEELQ